MKTNNYVLKRGFITLAYGNYYCELAEHLYLTYKLFGNCNYPFYVITNSDYKNRLEKTFDGVIVINDFVKSTVDKLKLFTDSPFSESIFIDSDCSIVNDVNYIFDIFEDGGSDISAIADIKELNNKEKGIQFGKNAIKDLNLKFDFPGFNGGVYYYKKNKIQHEIYIDFMFNKLIANYNYYGMRVRDNGKYADEPPVVLTMLNFNLKPIPVLSNIMNVVQNDKKVNWNMRNRKCNYLWYEYEVSPTIIHWTVGGTERLEYKLYDIKARYYLHKNVFKYFLDCIFVLIKYSIYPKLLKIFPFIHTIIDKLKND